MSHRVAWIIRVHLLHEPRSLDWTLDRYATERDAISLVERIGRFGYFDRNRVLYLPHCIRSVELLSLTSPGDAP